jgi:hypothetical protein
MVGRRSEPAWDSWWSLFLVLSLVASSCAGRSNRSGEGKGGDAARGGVAGASSGDAGEPAGGRIGGAGGRGGGDPGGAGAGSDAGAADGGEPGGAGGAAGGGASGDGGAGARPTAGVCKNPRAWLYQLVACEGDFVHRPRSDECSLPVRDEDVAGLPANAGIEDFENDSACDPPYVTCVLERNDCTRDADCGAGGYCMRVANRVFDENYEYYLLRVLHFCVAPCTTDSDCGSNEFCGCASGTQNATRALVSLGSCSSSDCVVDADCGPGAFCIASLTKPLPDLEASVLGTFHCQSPDDECHGPASCPVIDEDNVPTCEHDGDHFVCGEQEP